MSRQEPIDWSKVIIDRAPPVKQGGQRRPEAEPEVYDLFGPDPTPAPRPRREAELAG